MLQLVIQVDDNIVWFISDHVILGTKMTKKFALTDFRGILRIFKTPVKESRPG